MTCKPLTKEEADALRAMYWPKIIDDLNRDPGESLADWQARIKNTQDAMRLIRDNEGKKP